MILRQLKPPLWPGVHIKVVLTLLLFLANSSNGQVRISHTLKTYADVHESKTDLAICNV